MKKQILLTEMTHVSVVPPGASQCAVSAGGPGRTAPPRPGPPNDAKRNGQQPRRPLSPAALRRVFR